MKNNMNKNKKKIKKKNTRKKRTKNNYKNNTTSFYNFLSACLSSSSPAASGNWLLLGFLAFNICCSQDNDCTLWLRFCLLSGARFTGTWMSSVAKYTHEHNLGVSEYAVHEIVQKSHKCVAESRLQLTEKTVTYWRIPSVLLHKTSTYIHHYLWKTQDHV